MEEEGSGVGRKERGREQRRKGRKGGGREGREGRREGRKGGKEGRRGGRKGRRREGREEGEKGVEREQRREGRKRKIWHISSMRPGCQGSFGSVQRAKFQGAILAGGLAQESSCCGGWDLESHDLEALLWGLWLKPPPLPSPLLLQVLGFGSFPLRPSLTPKPSPRS